MTPLAALAALAIAAPPAAPAGVRIEYVAHACFVIESPGGARALVDPYNGTRWLGYSFPVGLAADAVLVSHPHYDHDASYYAPARAPVLRAPGSYAIGDLRVTGIEGRHAEPWGEEFGATNTLWLIETGGLRLAHLGDTGPLSEASLRALGTVDVLMLPVDDQDHVLKRAEVAAIRRALRPAVTIPMHYRLAGLTRLPDSLGTIDEWLAGERDVVRLASHAATVARTSGPPQVWVFPPSPAVAPWPPALVAAFEHRARARALAEREDAWEAALAERRRAAELSPTMLFVFEWARALAEAGRAHEARGALETALAGAGQDDWEYTARARDLLAGLYAARGERERAAAQYQLVLRDEPRHELRQRAEAFLAGGR
jgi:L-ascorbate metabolism protein UlaG (beta-lactamase superfamily)